MMKILKIVGVITAVFFLISLPCTSAITRNTAKATMENSFLASLIKDRNIILNIFNHFKQMQNILKNQLENKDTITDFDSRKISSKLQSHFIEIKSIIERRCSLSNSLPSSMIVTNLYSAMNVRIERLSSMITGTADSGWYPGMFLDYLISTLFILIMIGLFVLISIFGGVVIPPF